MNRRVFVSILVVAMLVVSMAVQSFAVPPDETATPSTDEMLSLVNEFRVTECRDNLTLSKTLCEAAQVRAKEMAQQTEISHNRPDGTPFSTSFEAAGDKGENVYCGGPMTAAEAPVRAFTAWKEKSEAHRQNMLDSSWGYMGVGYALGEDAKWYVCQLFCQVKPTADETFAPTGTAQPSNPATAEETAAPAATPTPSPTLDPNKVLQWIEAPDVVTAGDVITFNVVTASNVNLWNYGCTWIHPGRYKSDISKDLKTMTLRTKTADEFTVEFRIEKDNFSQTVSKKVKVVNAEHAELLGPDQVAPGKRATITLDTIAGATADDISWSVIPGLCALDFSADKRTCTFVSPTDETVQFIAKVKLKDSVATAKKTVKIESQLPVGLAAVTKGQVGYELEVHVDVDPLVRPANIYWSMYPGTCDAWFAPDRRTMYFTPTSTESLQITVRAEYEGKAGAAQLVVPVAPADSSAATAPIKPTSTPQPTVPAQTTQTGTTDIASSAIIPASILSAEATSTPTAAPTASPSGAQETMSPTATMTPQPTLDPLLPLLTAQPTLDPLLPLLTPAPTDPLLPIISPSTPSPTAAVNQTMTPELLPIWPENPTTPAPIQKTTPVPTTTPDVTQDPASSQAVPTASPEATRTQSSTEEIRPALQLVENAQISLQQVAGEDEQVAIAQPGDQLRVADIVSDFTTSDAQAVAVVSENGESVAPETNLATGQMIQVKDENGAVIQTVPVIVPGDVRGTGTMGISQLVRAVKAFTGEAPLTGVYLKAIKILSSSTDGDVSLVDIVHMAQLLTGKK